MEEILNRLNELESKLKELSGRADLNKEWLSAEEASRYTGYSKSQIYKFSCHPKYSNNIIYAVKPSGGRVMFKRTELDAFINQNIKR